MVVGFWGKLPSRGDFVGARLPAALVGAWDRWACAGIAASQGRLGENWAPAWREAPVWFFAATAHLLGPTPVAGLWMPSVDRAGRAFPLMIAATAPMGPDWYLAAEAAGRAALAEMLTPEALAARLPTHAPGPPLADQIAPGSSLWWTDGAPRVAGPGSVPFAGMPPAEKFAAMLDDAA